jgi:integrase
MTYYPIRKDWQHHVIQRHLIKAQISDKAIRPSIPSGNPTFFKRYMDRAITSWGLTNIKEIGYAEIEDLLFEQTDISDKTRANMKSCLHDFWTWLTKRRVLPKSMMPEFPETPYQLGWRKIIDKGTQAESIEEVRRISYHLNPKIWLGIRWLSIYIAARPGEILKLKEEDIDIRMGALIIPHPKEKRPKIIKLLSEDIKMLESIPRGLPHLRFFRHEGGIKRTNAGPPFGEKYFYKWWKKACGNLKIEGVDLYGGTRHSTATALREIYSPEQIRRNGTRHSSKAFDRYLQGQNEDALEMSRSAAEVPKDGAKVVNLSERRR